MSDGSTTMKVRRDCGHRHGRPVSGASHIAQFWRNLAGGVESVKFFSREELAARGVPVEELDDPLYVGASALLDGIEMFDADFFGFAPREAEITDPQHRVFLGGGREPIQ
jgi:phthiocerol/phenolphthiocerol synthesis type-I polyketide synthase E